MTYEFVICGAGFAGIVTCHYLLKELGINPNDILIIELGKEPGGLYKPWNSKILGPVDKGMHIYYETGIPEIDSIVYNSLDPCEWIILEGNRKDIAGAFYNNQLQKHTPYPDLRYISDSIKQKYISEIFEKFKRSEFENTAQNCDQYWKDRFGCSLADEVFQEISMKLYGHCASELNSTAAYITKLDRVCLFEKQTMEELGLCPEIRRILAYPDQLNMPSYRTNNQRGLYPKKGMKHLTEKMAEYLEIQGVTIKYETEVFWIGEEKGYSDIHNAGDCHISIFTQNPLTRGRDSIKTSKIIWTGSLPHLKKAIIQDDLQKNNMSRASSELNEKSCSLFLYYQVESSQHDLDQLYYAYFYDQETKPFRITNLSSYSRDEDNHNGVDLLCVEYHLTERQTLEVSQELQSDLNIIKKKEFETLSKLNLVDGKFIAADGFKMKKRIFPVPLLTTSCKLNIPPRIEQNIMYNGRDTCKYNFFLVDTLRSFYSQIHE